MALVSTVWGGRAWGALFLVFSEPQAAPGARVSLQTGGNGALAGVSDESPQLDVYLVRAGQEAAIASVDDSRLVLLGRLEIDERGDGRLQFVVPDVPAGRYTTMTHCVPCAQFSAGRELLPTGPHPDSFVVLDAGNEKGFSFVTAILVAGAAILVLGTVIALLVRRRSEAPRGV